jgi:hypothetical protein
LKSTRVTVVSASTQEHRGNLTMPFSTKLSYSEWRIADLADAELRSLIEMVDTALGTKSEAYAWQTIVSVMPSCSYNGKVRSAVNLLHLCNL